DDGRCARRGPDRGGGSRHAGCRRPRRLRRAVASFITFLTDFGLQDDFVGTCHGVMKRIAPEVEIIDITHGIAPQAVLQGALTLANTLPFMPEGVHLAVVDPGVGGARRALTLDRSHLDEAGVVPGTRVELQAGSERYYAVAARTFADARPGDIILYEDAYRNISIAINGGNAAAMFGIEEGQDIRIHLDAF